MAVAFVRDHINSSTKTSGSTKSYLLATGGSQAGNLLVAVAVFDNAAVASKPVITSIDKAAGETNNWVFLGAARSTSTSAGAFASGEMWAIKTTVSWPDVAAGGGSYTVNFDSAATMRAVDFLEFSGADAVPRSTAGAAYSTTTTAASATTTGTTPVIGDLAVGLIFGSNVAAAQAGDTDTTAGSWSAKYDVGSTGSGAATNNYGIAQYKILTAASHQTLNNSAAMTAGNGAIVAVLQAALEPTLTQAAYRLYADGTETGSTALAGQDTGHTADLTSGDVNLQVRVRMQSTNAAAPAATDDFQLQWEKNASGTWSDVVAQFTRTNLIPNPSAEVNATGWAASLNGTIARDGTKGGAVAGSGSWAVAATSTAAGAFFILGASPYAAVAPSTVYRASAYWWSPSGKVLTFIVGYYTSGLSFISEEAGVSGGGAGNWQRTDRTVTTPSNAGALRFRFDGGAAAGGEQFWVDAALLTEGSTLHAYFDGSTAGASWAGTAHNSVSILPIPATGVVPYASSNLTDGAATTNRLGAGSGTFTAGKISEDGLVDDLGWAANNHTEVLYSVTLKQADLANTDTVRFRVLRNGATTGLTYTQTPTITVLKGAPVGGKPKVWTGSTWTEKPVKVWTGSTWTEKPMKVWTGSSWVPV